MSDKEKKRKGYSFNNEKEWKINMMSHDKVDIVFMYRILLTENAKLRRKRDELESENLKIKDLLNRHLRGSEDT